jgi:son of sevenless-like protein
MTYKSFTTLDDFFDHLVRRFRIQIPEGLSPTESEEWRKLKQHVIQMRCVIIESSPLYLMCSPVS